MFSLLLITITSCEEASQTSSSEHILQDQQDALNDAKAAADAMELKLKEAENKLDAIRDQSSN